MTIVLLQASFQIKANFASHMFGMIQSVNFVCNVLCFEALGDDCIGPGCKILLKIAFACTKHTTLKARHQNSTAQSTYRLHYE